MISYWTSANGVEHLVIHGKCATCGKRHPLAEQYSTSREGK
jgi:hypothetical protein